MKKLFAEFFGTFWLVFGGCGSAIFAAAYPELGIGFAGERVHEGEIIDQFSEAWQHIGDHFSALSAWGEFKGRLHKWPHRVGKETGVFIEALELLTIHFF